MGRPPVDAILLDLDDTLMDTRAAFHRATAEVAGRWLAHLTPEQVAEAGVRWATDPSGSFRAYTRGEITFLEQRRRRVDDLHAAYGGKRISDDEFDAWNASYDKGFRSSWTLFSDVIPLLDELTRRGVAHGILTNSTRALSLDKLERLGLAARIDLLVSPDDLGFGKPDRRVFTLACERLGARPDRTAYVGDELDVDAMGARDAGLVGVWLDRRGERTATGRSVPPDIQVIGGLGELLNGLDLGAVLTRR